MARTVDARTADARTAEARTAEAQTLVFRLAVLAAVVGSFVLYWLPFLRGQKHFLHDSLAHATLLGLFHDRLFGGDSWLWSAALNGGHPLWPSLEVAPIADPVAFLVYSAAVALKLDWLTPFTLTAFVWLLVFATGGALCARVLTGDRWAALLAFVLLCTGSLALAIPAQTSGFLAPYRYFPLAVYFYFKLREKVTLRDTFTFNATLAFSLAGYQSVFPFILFLALVLAEVLLGPRAYLAWLRRFLSFRFLAMFSIPLLALAPTVAWLLYTTELVAIPRAYMSWHVYFARPGDFIADIFVPYTAVHFKEVLRNLWHGSTFIGLLPIPFLLLGLRRSIMDALAPRRRAAGIKARLSAVTVAWLVIVGVLACGLLGLREFVEANGLLLGVRNFGFLLSGAIFLLVLLVARGFAEILAGRYALADIGIDSLIFAGVALVSFGSLAPFRTVVWSWVALVALFTAVGCLWLVLRLALRTVLSRRFEVPCFVAAVMAMVLVESLWVGSIVMPSLERLLAVPDKEATRSLVETRQPSFRSRSEVMPDNRAYAFSAASHWPFHLEGPAMFRDPSALTEPIYLKRIGRKLMRWGLTQTHLFRLHAYDELLRDDAASAFAKEILGVTRPLLELVPKEAIGSEPGQQRLVMNDERDGARSSPSFPAAGEILGRDYQGDRLAVTLRADEPAVLVYRDNFAPGWTARLDGEPVRLLIVDRLNKAVEVPAGEHRVEFRYRPWAYLAGFAVRTAVLIADGLVCLVLLARRRRSAMPRSSGDR